MNVYLDGLIKEVIMKMDDLLYAYDLVFFVEPDDDLKVMARSYAEELKYAKGEI